jgi:hypothetical protein
MPVKKYLTNVNGAGRDKKTKIEINMDLSEAFIGEPWRGGCETC